MINCYSYISNSLFKLLFILIENPQMYYFFLFLSISIYFYLFLSVFICFYLFLSVSICFYLFLSISICFYLFLSISINLYLSLSISIYLYLFPSISIYLLCFSNFLLLNYLLTYLMSGATSREAFASKNVWYRSQIYYKDTDACSFFFLLRIDT